MDQFIASCNAAPDYPRNIINHNTYEYILRAYTERLNEQERRIFSDETKAAQEFWEFDDSDPGELTISLIRTSGLLQS